MTINEFKKEYKKQINVFDNYIDDKKVYAFLSYILFDDGSEMKEDINDNNIFFDDVVNFIDVDFNNEIPKITFVKISNNDDILNNYLSILLNVIKEMDGKYKEVIDDINTNNECDKKYKFIFINFDENKTIKNKEYIYNDLKNNPDFAAYFDEYQIIDYADLKKRISRNTNRELFVNEWTFSIDKQKNYLEYTPPKNSLVNKAIICNISAKDLKELYKKYDNNILDLNLRFFVKNKSIDNDIKNSIQEGTNFWFLNNGLYIICDSFSIDENSPKINFKKFSVINGGQTTYNISNTEFDKDFFLVCKIISIENWSRNDKKKNAFELANKISIASNKQKSIKNCDLISNHPKVTNLKDTIEKYNNFLFDEPIFIETKKGEFVSLNTEIKKEYKKKNKRNIDFLLELKFSWYDMIPGSARKKDYIYKDEEELDKSLSIISKNIGLFFELIQIENILDDLKSDIKKQKWDKEINNVIKYFNFYLISLFRILWLYINTDKSEQSTFYSNIANLKTNNELKMFADEKENSLFFNNKSCSRKIKLLNKNIKQRKSLKDMICEFIMSISRDAIDESLNYIYNSDDYSNIRDIAKLDNGLLVFLRSVLKQVKNNTEIKDNLKEIFNCVN